MGVPATPGLHLMFPGPVYPCPLLGALLAFRRGLRPSPTEGGEAGEPGGVINLRVVGACRGGIRLPEPPWRGRWWSGIGPLVRPDHHRAGWSLESDPVSPGSYNLRGVRLGPSPGWRRKGVEVTPGGAGGRGELQPRPGAAGLPLDALVGRPPAAPSGWRTFRGTPNLISRRELEMSGSARSAEVLVGSAPGSSSRGGTPPGRGSCSRGWDSRRVLVLVGWAAVDRPPHPGNIDPGPPPHGGGGGGWRS